MSPGITTPAAINAKEPEYTEGARKKRIQGNVVLSVVVGPNGRVCDARIERSLYPELDDRAIETVDKWLFRPAQKDGKPIAVRISVQVQFRLY